ncbi:hypothetical protein [uncultured Ornithinimicrobium sp.]|uniref:hypothetical protein n=1 Tax=uncultured Ornithinimicrobium sp. TaxID=259307 RepID=UPI00259A974D|nr:hypothetical protein [uncultured Ornithinimicrobium sp.]
MGMFEAAARRRRAAQMQRRLAELDEWDRQYGLGGAPPGSPLTGGTGPWRYHSPEGGPPPVPALAPVPLRPPVRRRRRSWPGVLVVLGLVGAGLTYPDRAVQTWSWAQDTGRSVLGLPEQEPEPPLPDASPVAPDVVVGPQEDRAASDPVDPAAQGSAGGRFDDLVPDFLPRSDPAGWGWEPPRGERLLPAVAPQTDDAYAFLATQPRSEEPVGFSPCGPVEVAVNPAGAPEGYADLVLASLARISDASGLHLELVGETDRTWSDDPASRGEPVLVGWATDEEVPALEGPSAGFGGPTVVTFPDGRSWNASGQVVLDTDQLSTPEAHAAVLDHELAHVLGLGHVDAPGELMTPVNTGQAHFGPGDLAGLARLGAIPCP